MGLGLVGMIVPVLGDVDNDGKKDSVSKYLMYKVMATQEDSKAKVEAFQDETEEAGDSDAVEPMKQGFDKKSEEDKE